MTLFGGAAPATMSPPAAKPVPVTVPAVAVQEPGVPAAVPAMPAYQRRRILREKRHSLVNDLRRRNGGSPQEINAWLNRETGVTKVGEASIEQLEQSIELLMQALTKRAARGRAGAR